MTILLYKDGRLVIDDGNPIEGNSLDGLVACVADPQSGDTLKYDGKQWVAGAAASGLPTVSGDDNGKVLTVVEGEWAPAAGGGGGGTLMVDITYENDKFTMDKTAAEIFTAVSAGISVVCHFPDASDGPSGPTYENQYGALVACSKVGDETYVLCHFMVQKPDGYIEEYQSSSLDGYPFVDYS